MKKLTFVIFPLILTACYSSGGGGGSVNVPTSAKELNAPTQKGSQGSTKSDSKTNQNDVTNHPSDKGGNQPKTPKGDTLIIPNGSNNNASTSTFSTATAGTFNNVATDSLNGIIYIPSEHKAINPNKGDYVDWLQVNGVTMLLLSPYDKLNGSAIGKLKELTTKDILDGSAQSISGYVGSYPDAYGSLGKPQDPNSFKALRYGVLNLNGTSHLFVQGFLTPKTGTIQLQGETVYSMPRSDAFKYTGFAVYGKDNQYNQLKSEVVADFTNKKVKIDLLDGETIKATFGGEINGNQFAGTRNNIESKGAFYGSQARDVGGIFYDNNTGNNGAFGASDKKVTQAIKNF